MKINTSAFLFVAVFTSLLLSVGSASGVTSNDDKQPPMHRYKDGELLVKFEADTSRSTKENIHKKHGSKRIKEFRDLRIDHVHLEDGLSIEEAVALYRTESGVEYAEPNFMVSAATLPNDPSFDLLWGLYNHGQTGGTAGADIRAPWAWDIASGSSDVIVAVIDSGIYYNHEDLTANLWVNTGEISGNGMDDDLNGYIDDVYGINTVTGTGDPMDDLGHGTHVAGIIGAVGNNGRGTAGMNWSTQILSCKFLGSSGYGSTADALECLEYIRRLKSQDVNIVVSNNSWGCRGCYSQALSDAINAQRASDILFVAAAGNDSADNDASPYYPASYPLPNVIAVAATDHNDLKALFSNYGLRSVHVGAPGADIFSTLPSYTHWGDSLYGYLSGTSMAAPYVAGLAALLTSARPGSDWKAVKNLILSGGDDTESMQGATITGKRINAYGSLTCMDKALFSILQCPTSVQSGVPVTLSALSINCASPAGPVLVTTAGGEVIELFDTGAFPDKSADDGIFTGTWTPVREDEGLSFSSPSGTRSAGIPPLSITSEVLLEASFYSYYRESLAASGGSPPYTWSVTAGALPEGLHLDPVKGEISGNAARTGTFAVTVHVADTRGTTASKNFVITVSEGPLLNLWSRTHDMGLNDWGQAVTSDTSGNVYVTGYFNNGFNDDILTVKYDASGNLLWAKTYNRGSHDRAFAVSADTSGNVYVTGLSFVSNYDALTIKYNPSGNLLWAQLYNNGSGNISRALAIDGNGNVYITGYADNGTNTDYFIGKYDSTGNLLWTRSFDSGQNDEPYGIAVSAEGAIAVTGLTYAVWPYSDYLTIRYDEAGNLLWVKTYSLGDTDWARGITLDRDGNISVTGYSDAGTTSDYLTVKYDPSGNLVWAKTFDNGSQNEAYAITSDANGDLYVAGESYAGSSRDWVVIKYDLNGDVVWSKTFDTGLPDYARGITVDGIGNVYVAGYIQSKVGTDFIVAEFRELTLPTGSVTINSGAHYTHSPLVTLALTCSGSQGGICSQMQFSNDGMTWTPFEPYGPSKDWAFPPGDGIKTVSVRFQDRSGYSSTVYSDTILLDSVPPSGSMAIDSGAEITYDASVLLTLTCTDSGSGCSELQFSNDAITWSAAEPFAATRAWTLAPGDGDKTVFVKFGDTAGNWSEANGDTIILSTLRPDLSVASLSGPLSTSAGSTVLIQYEIVNSGPGIAGSSIMKLSLSKDRIASSDDVLLDSRPVPLLFAGDGSQGTTEVNVPAQMPAGNYYIIAVADADGIVPEARESNNSLFWHIRLKKQR